MTTKITLLSFALLLVFACKKSDDSRFVGEWTSTKKPIPYSANLVINSNHTFAFNGGACSSLFGADGKWKVDNDTLILISDKIDKQFCIVDFDNNCTTVKFVKRGEENLSKLDCKNKIGKEYVNFKNEMFYFKNDTLKHKSRNAECEIKNDFVKVKNK